MSWFQAHQILHAAMYGLLAAGVLSFGIGFIKGASPHFRFAGMNLAVLAALAWMGHDFVVSKHSPTEVLTGRVLSRNYHYQRHNEWYTFALQTNGAQIDNLVWLPMEQKPPIGGTVAVTVYQWNRGDTVALHILSGKAAGYAWQSHNTSVFDIFMVLPALVILVLFLGWWYIYTAAAASEAKAAREASAEA